MAAATDDILQLAPSSDDGDDGEEETPPTGAEGSNHEGGAVGLAAGAVTEVHVKPAWLYVRLRVAGISFSTSAALELRIQQAVRALHGESGAAYVADVVFYHKARGEAIVRTLASRESAFLAALCVVTEVEGQPCRMQALGHSRSLWGALP